MKKILCYFLLLAMMVPFAACGNKPADKAENPAESNSGNAVAENTDNVSEEASAFPSSIPENLTFNGATFNFMSREESDGFWDIIDLWKFEEATGELLNDAIFERNILVEDTFDCELTQIRYPCLDYNSILARSVKADDDAYQAVLVGNRQAPVITIAGSFMDLNDVSSMDLTQPWWDQKLNGYLSVVNRQYYAIGDFNLMALYATSAMIYNKEIAAEYQMPDFHQLVAEGKWTMDVYAENMLVYNEDLNHDGVMNFDDQWGAITGYDIFMFHFNACGESIGVKDQDGIVTLSPLSDRMLAVLEKITPVFKLGNVYNPHDEEYNPGGSSGSVIQMFMDDRALFFLETLRITDFLREMESEYGLLPMPKFDESQEDYIAPVQDWGASATAIPVTNDNYEDVAKVIEILSYMNHQTIRDQLVQTVSYKGLRDTQSVEVFNLLYENRYLDIAAAYGNQAAAPFYLYLLDAAKKGGGFASAYESNSRAAEKLLANAMGRIADFEY